MATLDLERKLVVVRIVYDGAPLSGKTTSLQALAEQLASNRRTAIFSPHSLGSRTTFFDWMEYTGGLIEGYQVHCQIVTVPGQQIFAERRRHLVASADSVVFVADGDPEGLAPAVERFRALLPLLDDQEPPVGVVIQANKRDLPDSVAIEELRRAFREEREVAVLESVANQSQGVRETFIFAVRLALDRARELMRARTLAIGAPQVASGEALLAELEALEAHQRSGPAAMLPTLAVDLVTMSADGPSTRGETSREPPSPAGEPGEEALPLLPTADVPSGLVWPPVAGRILLSELAAEGVRLERTPEGDWAARSRSWSVLSPAEARFERLDDGQRALLASARQHHALGPLVSRQRGLVLAPTGATGWRLWQVLHLERSLRDFAIEALLDPQADRGADRLLDAAIYLRQAAETFERMPQAGLAAALESLPPPGAPIAFCGHLGSQGSLSVPGQRVADEFGALIRDLSTGVRLPLGRLHRRLTERASGIGAAGQTAGLLAELLTTSLSA